MRLCVSQQLSVTPLLWWHLISLLGVLCPSPQLRRPYPTKICHSLHLSELCPLLNSVRRGLPGQRLLEWKHGSLSITNTKARKCYSSALTTGTQNTTSYKPCWIQSSDFRGLTKNESLSLCQVARRWEEKFKTSAGGKVKRRQGDDDGRDGASERKSRVLERADQRSAKSNKQVQILKMTDCMSDTFTVYVGWNICLCVCVSLQTVYGVWSVTQWIEELQVWTQYEPRPGKYMNIHYFFILWFIWKFLRACNLYVECVF